MKHLIGTTRNDIPVHVDLIRSQAAAHIARQPYLLGLVREALGKVTAHGATANLEHDMGRAIGYDFVVQTTDADSIYYAQLVRDTLYTRFTKNGKPAPTQYLTMVLRRAKDNTYDLYDTWIGRISPPRPGSANETDESRPYWANHAFVLDHQSLQLRTITKVCPY